MLMQELTFQSLDRYEELIKTGKTKGLKTGLRYFDRVTGGFIGSKLIIISARPGIGKTSMMLTMARYMAFGKHCVGIFSIEMDKEEIDDRFMSMQSGINILRLITDGNLTPEDWEKINKAAEVKSKWNIMIDDTGGLHIMELCRRARQMKKDGAEIIFIDQFSKIKTDSKNKTRFEQKSEIVERLGDLKKELRIPIVLLAQINRNISARNNKRPTLSDLKDTGQLEEEADMVLFIHREEKFCDMSDPENHKYIGEVNLDVAKNRQGPCLDILLRFDERNAIFYNIEDR